MAMKVIDFPADLSKEAHPVVGVKNPVITDLTFKQYLIQCMDTFPPTSQGGANIRRTIQVITAIGSCDEKVGLKLDPECYSFLAAAVQAKEWKDQPILGRVFLPYMEAVEKGHDEIQEKK
jgi:hypothetical protein